MTLWLALQLLLLVIAANLAPLLAQLVMRRHWEHAVDGGRLWRDQRPLLGAAKTWRGLLAALLLTTLLSASMGLGWTFGLCFGALAMAGDLCSSFIKRRRGLVASSRAAGLDQIPESLLPLVFSSVVLQLNFLYALLLSLLFMIGSLILSPLLFRWGVRKRPY